MRSVFVVGLLLLAATAPAPAQDKPAAPAAPAPAPPPKPLTPEQAADSVLAAVATKDDANLKTLAAKDDPDPWLVADELCARGKFDAADAFAKAAPRVDVEKLPEYVASNRAHPTGSAARAAFAKACAALDASEDAGVLAAVESETRDGRDVVAVRLEYSRGLALSGLRQFEESVAAFRTAGDAALSLGWLARAAAALHASGVGAFSRSDFGGAIASWEARLSLEERRSCRTGAAETLGNIALVLGNLGAHGESLDFAGRALKVAEELGDRRIAASLLSTIGSAHNALGRYAEALEFQERSLHLKEELGDRFGIAIALGNIANVHENLAAFTKALEFNQRALKLFEELGARREIAAVLGNLGNVHQTLGASAQALECHQRSLAICEETGDRAGTAHALGSIGVVHESLGAHLKAREFTQRALDLKQELGDRAGVAIELGNLGVIQKELGEYTQAVELHERALKIKEETGDRAGAATTLGNIAAAYSALGAHARALELLQRAVSLHEELGDRAGTALCLTNLGIVHNAMGSSAKALMFHERALKLQEELGTRRLEARTLSSMSIIYDELGVPDRALEFAERALKIEEEVQDRAGAAQTLANIGSLRAELGSEDKAIEFFNRSLTLLEDLGDRASAAQVLCNLGLVRGRLGSYDAALETLGRAMKIQEDLGLRANVALTLGNIGSIHRRMGAFQKGLECEERSLAIADDVGDVAGQVFALGNMASCLSSLGRPSEAAAKAREAVRRLPGLVGGEADEHGAAARSRYRDLFTAGLFASVSQRDPAGVSFFLESGRAGGLRESLRARESLQGVVLPPDLAAAERGARSRQTAATAALQQALRSGAIAQIKASRADLDAARRAVESAVERIQRTEKAAASLLYPAADELAVISGRLGDGDALVSYGLGDADAVALVVTRNGGRIVPLGRTAEIAAACAALAPDNVGADPASATDSLRKLTVEPLGLDAKTTRVLVSSDGALSYVPFALLLGDREVAYVPSGTVHGLLLDDAAKRGDGVLALGDPDYDAKPTAGVVAVRSGGYGNLVRLPATGVEAKTVGDVVLLGKDATKSGLRDALAKRPRWRAVHLACHGLVDPERPMFSSLALTPSGDDDGFLTALEVFRMKCPADLVVLSACETGKGKVYKAEGIVGLTRAFMFAGAPRVLVSLWKVDDEATGALMKKFYELWNPKDGKGVPAARALRDAQTFIRSQEKWKHPRYWAAWVLWGLPE